MTMSGSNRDRFADLLNHPIVSSPQEPVLPREDVARQCALLGVSLRVGLGKERIATMASSSRRPSMPARTG